MNGAIRISVVVALHAAMLVAQEARMRAQGDRDESPITFNKHVAPIMFARCASCHRPGQAAPFSLLTFEDVRPRARQIAEVTRTRTMPPWKPQPGHGAFIGERRLTELEIRLIELWVKGGMVRGTPADLPSTPRWPDTWQLGVPDVVVAMPEPYMLPAQKRDVFRTFVLPIPLQTSRYVRGVEFRAANFSLVHHANIKVDRTRLSRRWDEDEPGPGYEGGGSREALFPDGVFLGWTPGQSPRVSPPQMAWRLEPSSDLVLELHLMPSTQPEPLLVSVGLFFTDEPPLRTGYMLRLGRQDLDIAPGQRDYVNADSYTLPVDVELLAVQPHAHFLAKEIRSWATRPDGSTEPLLFIDDWDFNWQEVYTYAHPVRLPKGTTIEMRYTYDNSAANRRNPHRPPRRVTFGQTSASEMGSLWLQVVPGSVQDRAILDKDFAPKILRDDIAGNEKWLEVEPHNAHLRAELAACYLEANRLDEALLQLREAARLDPTAGRHYDVGRVLLLQEKHADAAVAFQAALSLNSDFGEAVYGLAVATHGQDRLEEAILLYERVIDRDPANASAHYNIGRALERHGHVERAIASYRTAIGLAPEDADAHHSLGRVLALEGQLSDAVYHYRRSLEIDPNVQGALLDLAWILATSTDPSIRVPQESVRLAQRAAGLAVRADATVLDTLAAAYAAAGYIDRAVATAEKALAVALENRESQLAAQIRSRLERYRSVPQR